MALRLNFNSRWLLPVKWCRQNFFTNFPWLSIWIYTVNFKTIGSIVFEIQKLGLNRRPSWKPKNWKSVPKEFSVLFSRLIIRKKFQNRSIILRALGFWMASRLNFNSRWRLPVKWYRQNFFAILSRLLIRIYTANFKTIGSIVFEI